LGAGDCHEVRHSAWFLTEVRRVTITAQWSRLGLGAIVGFLVGWYVFGLFGATVLAIVVMFAMGIIKVK